MSKEKSQGPVPDRPGAGKPERYVQPSLLMGLKPGPSYGYELIQEIKKFNFIDGQPPPGMIYRHLRGLEADGLVRSEWLTDGSGPAKRVYHLTADGEAALRLWIEYMRDQRRKLQDFIKAYETLAL
jgi:DNA-binding PadR family transcriptional regulator